MIGTLISIAGPKPQLIERLKPFADLSSVAVGTSATVPLPVVSSSQATVAASISATTQTFSMPQGFTFKLEPVRNLKSHLIRQFLQKTTPIFHIISLSWYNFAENYLIEEELSENALKPAGVKELKFSVVGIRLFMFLLTCFLF